MKIKVLREVFTVCKIESISQVDFKAEYCFLSKTDEDLSLVCTDKNVPNKTLDREDGWRRFRIQGELDFLLYLCFINTVYCPPCIEQKKPEKHLDGKCVFAYYKGNIVSLN